MIIRDSNIKRFSLCLILIICASIVKSQTVRGILTRGSGKLFISYDKGKSRAIVNERVVTVKLKDGMVLDNSLKILRSNRLGYIDLSVPEGVDVTEFVETLEKRGSYEMVKYADLGETCMTPNDTYVSNQWYLSTINMPSTWNITTGSPDVRVAVLDLEIDWNHQDIGMGNDGYKNIDNTLGYNYKENTSLAVSPEEHGTLVAGIIGAKTNNMTGIAGISGGNGGQGVTIIPYGVGSSLGSPYIDMSVVDDAILDAVDKGAKVINMSLGSTSSYYPDIDAAILYAHNHGVTLVAASGNDYSSAIRYPASHSKVIAVGASDNTNHRASFSSYGTGLDLVAPGVDIYSTTLNNGYDSESGTSFSAPQVSGVAALMLSLNPTLAPDSIRSILRSTCTKISGYSYNSGWNNETGYGLLNAYAAVNAVAPKIIGHTIFTDTMYYSVNNLPEGWNVTWQLSPASSFVTLQILPNDSLGRPQCMLTKDTRYPYDGYIQATLYRNNDTITTLSKKLYGHLAKGRAYYVVRKYPGNQVVDAALIPPGNIIKYIKVGDRFNYSSPNFKGMRGEEDVWHPNSIPYCVTRDEDSDNFTIWPQSTGYVIYRLINREDPNYVYVFVFNVEPASKGYSMLLTKSGNNYQVKLVGNENMQKVEDAFEDEIAESRKITLEVYDSTSAKPRISTIVRGNTTSFDTNGWAQGLYIVKAIVKGNTLTEKIIIDNK